MKQEGKLSQSCYPGPAPCNLLAKAPLTVLPWKYCSTVSHSVAKKIASVPSDERMWETRYSTGSLFSIILGISYICHSLWTLKFCSFKYHLLRNEINLVITWILSRKMSSSKRLPPSSYIDKLSSR